MLLTSTFKLTSLTYLFSFKAEQPEPPNLSCVHFFFGNIKNLYVCCYFLILLEFDASNLYTGDSVFRSNKETED